MRNEEWRFKSLRDLSLFCILENRIATSGPINQRNPQGFFHSFSILHFPIFIAAQSFSDSSGSKGAPVRWCSRILASTSVRYQRWYM